MTENVFQRLTKISKLPALVLIATKGIREIFRGERLGQIGILILLAFMLVAVFAPLIAPYEPFDRQYDNEENLQDLEPPSDEHYFGTTRYGRDVFSQVIYSSRVSLFVGFVAALVALFIGGTIGTVSGYYGGAIDDLLMRITDIMYGIPFIPFMIVLVTFIGQDILNIALAIAIVIWRSPARVIRSQVLTVKERPYIESAEAVGSSDFRIMVRHIIPNILPLIILYGAFAVAWAIIGEASIAFLGFGDPERISWGAMMFGAYATDSIRYGWFWVVPAGLCISLVVVSTFFVARTFEKVANPEMKEV